VCTEVTEAFAEPLPKVATVMGVKAAKLAGLLLVLACVPSCKQMGKVHQSPEEQILGRWKNGDVYLTFKEGGSFVATVTGDLRDASKEKQTATDTYEGTYEILPNETLKLSFAHDPPLLFPTSGECQYLFSDVETLRLTPTGELAKMPFAETSIWKRCD
jgi:hypothetical protein